MTEYEDFKKWCAEYESSKYQNNPPSDSHNGRFGMDIVAKVVDGEVYAVYK